MRMLLGSQAIHDDGHLWVGGCDTVELAHTYGTPLYVIDDDGLRETCRRFVRAFHARWSRSEVAYACKAFSAGALVRSVVEEGLGLDVVSEGELALALSVGAPPQAVTVHGNFKSERQIAHAVESGVGRIAIDSLGEAARIAAAARRVGRRQPVLVRLNPAVDVKADKRFSTGEADSKFGLSIEDGSAERALSESLAEDALELEGLHFHLGSQLKTHVPYRNAMRNVARFLCDAPVQWRPHRIVIGGGMAARYAPTDSPPAQEAWADALVGAFEETLPPHCHDDVVIGIEPGRSISAENGLMLYTVGPIKPATGGSKPIDAFVAVDGGLSDNPKLVMSIAHHEALLASAADAPDEITVEICGWHCGTDTLLPAVGMPHLRTGDVLALQSAGAYTHCMASNYNRFPRPAVVCVGGGESRLVNRRETIEDMMRTEVGMEMASSMRRGPAVGERR